MHMAIENSADQQGGGWVFSSLRDARAACGQRPKQELLHGEGSVAMLLTGNVALVYGHTACSIEAHECVSLASLILINSDSH